MGPTIQSKYPVICSIRTESSSKKIVEINSTIKDVSKLPYHVKVIGPDFYLASGCMCCVCFEQNEDHLFIYIRSKSNKKIDLTRTLVLYDSGNKLLYEETDAKIFSLQKDADEDLIGEVRDRRRFDTLSNDTLIIKLSVHIQKSVTKRSNKSVSNTDIETKLKEDFKTMLENPINSDVSLQFGEEQIPAHWSVLCSRSPYFKRMFENEMKERIKNSVTITEISINTFKILVEFLYTANFVPVDEANKLEELFGLYYAADKYEVMDLRTLCADEIMDNASPDNVCEILQIAYRHSDKELKMKAVSFIQQHSETVLQTDGWKKFEANEPLIAEAFSFFLKKNHNEYCSP